MASNGSGSSEANWLASFGRYGGLLMPKIVISYRRADSDATGRVFDRLSQRYGKQSVFRDIDNIPFGTDFRKAIDEALHETDVLIAIVGPNWRGGTGKRGSSRIKEVNDPLRIEIETALRTNIPIIPVLVGGAVMPKPAELPESLHDFAFRNAATIDSGRNFDNDMDRLMRSMDRLITGGVSESPRPGSSAAAGDDSEAPLQSITPLASAPNIRSGTFRFPGRSIDPEATKEASTAAKPIDGGDSLLPKAFSEGGSKELRDSPQGCQILPREPRSAWRRSLVLLFIGGLCVAVTIGAFVTWRSAGVGPCGSCLDMAIVAPGSFVMGSSPSVGREGPSHNVSIPQPLAVDRFAVTFAQWDACVDDGGCNLYRPSDEGWGRGNRPVINVSWQDAKAYIGWLSKKSGLQYRLPSEAEREYFTRAGTTADFWWGNSANSQQANYKSAAADAPTRTTLVKTFDPNPWGLYQVSGNVWEWTEDCMHPSYQGAPTDGSAWIEGGICGLRILRGGGWDEDAINIRSSNRGWNVLELRSKTVGFRIVRTLGGS